MKVSGEVASVEEGALRMDDRMGVVSLVYMQGMS